MPRSQKGIPKPRETLFEKQQFPPVPCSITVYFAEQMRRRGGVSGWLPSRAVRYTLPTGPPLATDDHR